MKFFRFACGISGVLLIVAAFLPIVHVLAIEYLLSVHILRQLTVSLGAPLLLLWAVPPRAAPSARLPWWLCWIAGMIAISVWYVPRIFALLIRHGAMDISTLVVSAGLGIVFWLPLFSPWNGHRLGPVPGGIVYLLCATIFASCIGVALTFVKPEVYANYVNPKDSLGILDALQTKWDLARDKDQQTAGLLMWIGSCTFFLSAVMLMFYRLYVSSSAESR